MKQLVIDSSSLISLSTNCLLWVLDQLKSIGVQFIVTPEVRSEVINRALGVDKFRLSAVRVLKRLCNGTIIVKESNPTITNKILNEANKVFSVNNEFFKIIHPAEMSLVQLAQENGTDSIVIDERIVDKLINNPQGLRLLLEHRLHTKVTLNKAHLKEFKALIKNVNIFKSTDLVVIAFEKGLMKDYLNDCASKKVNKDFISGALWGLKMSGCAVSTKDINEYLKQLF
ncbi:MAG: hypothetical protein WC307_03590 [Candidatus Nanoarchaeia archaeon]|jgi:hypothetical protein